MEELYHTRPIRSDPQEMLFELEPDWRKEWWGMPVFKMENTEAQFRITINFMTYEDLERFKTLTELPITSRSDSAWFPPQERLRGEYYFDGPKRPSKYPVCVPSKGRADCQTTGHALEELGVDYRFFVEETEYDAYCENIGEEKIIKLPFHDLGQGSVPARNFIWEWAREREFKRHWTVDDNILSFQRCTHNRRLSVKGGGFFRAMEDFVDRYENVVMAGPHARGFVSDRPKTVAPFRRNIRVYSCILLDTTLPHRWRGRYNEDTDLSLRLLKDGYCTIVFCAFMMAKGPTAFSKNSKPMKGGNTDNVYNTGDHRRRFAESLKEQHPDVTKVTWKFNRWHHSVDYSFFQKNNKLKLKEDVTPILKNDNYEMEFKKVDAPKIAFGDLLSLIEKTPDSALCLTCGEQYLDKDPNSIRLKCVKCSKKTVFGLRKIIDLDLIET